MRITLSRGRPLGYVLTAEDGRSVLVQTDWDYPGVASSFGFNLADVQVMNRRYYGLAACQHDGTDGTIKCQKCGLLPVTFIEAAAAYLDEQDGAEVDDPGYFDELAQVNL